MAVNLHVVLGHTAQDAQKNLREMHPRTTDLMLHELRGLEVPHSAWINFTTPVVFERLTRQPEPSWSRIRVDLPGDDMAYLRAPAMSYRYFQQSFYRLEAPEALARIPSSYQQINRSEHPKPSFLQAADELADRFLKQLQHVVGVCDISVRQVSSFTCQQETTEVPAPHTRIRQISMFLEGPVSNEFKLLEKLE